MLPAGKRLGPYEIVSLIGSGGMGEVYRARDPRLGRDVALKIIRGELVEGGDRLRRFEREARAAASLNHPNILTVHDVGSADGTAYVVTELLEGETLRAVLSRRSPAQRQVLSYGLQAAHGLAAAHLKGIVHRDLKPENLFLTADGRVKILDFGLAKLDAAASADSGEATAERATRPGVLMGTVAYMSPEQVKALAVDAQSDIFSFGVVLYELLSRRHPFRREAVAATLTAILQETPPDLTSLDPAIPPFLAGIVRRCMEKEKQQRFHGAHDLALALEAVMAVPTGTASVGDLEDRSPYPGLSSFMERDAAFFFGREAEVEGLWRRLQDRRLLAVIGPSGTGKTSLVRAGVVASRPAGWGALVCTPGAAPFRALGRALAPELAGDPDALRQLLSFEETETAVDLVGRWRRAHAEALLVVDQFEELFTLNPPESQERFATLLARLAGEADVRVLLSMRDDFLIRCSEHDALAPVFESLTPLAGLGASALRRALVEPAGRRGYRFEDGALVEEMIQSVEGSRGALPLLAFAVARLWETRDRERKLLTRKAYEEIGGVAGALAQHAEAAMERIGPERQSIVREIFRNLVTAEGTRAVADRDELLSLFPERAGDAAAVLEELIEARLLTSYEVEGAEGQPARHRVEVVHESLLEAWPRLVRWQAQDEDGALLRDQLKQAAHLWEEKGRTPDLLWTGTAFREFELWRERYAGALTALEEDFAKALVERAQRQRRRRRAIAGAIVAAALAVAAVTGGLWRRSEASRRHAQNEALRAEAGKLLALGRAQLDSYPTAALAYARKSLELADTPEARHFAVEVLWRGPTARILKELRPSEAPGYVWGVALSPDGNWLATTSTDSRRILVFPRDGMPPQALPRPPDANADVLAFGPQNDLLVTGGSGASLRFWSLPGLREVRSTELGGVGSWGFVRGGMLLTFTAMSDGSRHLVVRSWPLPEGEPKALGRSDRGGRWDVDPTGTWLAFGRGRTIRLRALDAARLAPERILGSHRDELEDVTIFPEGDRLASVDKSGEIRLWSVADGTRAPLRILQGPRVTFASLYMSREGAHLARGATESSAYLWDLGGPPNAEPVLLKRPDPASSMRGAFDPEGQWLIAGNGYTIAFWPLSNPWIRVLRGGGPGIWSMSFTADSRWLASCAYGEPARLWPLSAAGGDIRTLVPKEPCWSLATHPAGTRVLVGTRSGKVLLFPTAGRTPRQLLGGWEGAAAYPVAFDPQGRRAVAGPTSVGSFMDPKQRVLRIWDLESRQERVLSVAHLTDTSWGGFDSIRFAPDGALFVAGQGGVHRLVLPTDPGGALSTETVYATGRAIFDLSRDGRYLLAWGSKSDGTDRFDELLLFDLAKRTSRRITSHGSRLFTGALDASGQILVTGDIDGVVRAGPVTGEEPHLLLGHTGQVTALAVSPDGRWIASATDQAIHLWPMPDVSKPPLHTRPHDELLAKLDSLTNLRVVADPSAPTGWKLDVSPFPGWKDVPTW